MAVAQQRDNHIDGDGIAPPRQEVCLAGGRHHGQMWGRRPGHEPEVEMRLRSVGKQVTAIAFRPFGRPGWKNGRDNEMVDAVCFL